MSNESAPPGGNPGVKTETRSSGPWVEKYRPKTLDELQGHDGIKTMMRHYARTRFAAMPHCMFHGPPGTGKTSAALILADMMHGSSRLMYRFLNASDTRGIDTIRELTSYVSQDLGADAVPRLVILDEADNLTPDAQFALRRTMETYVQTSRFVLLCNHAERLIDALHSRCICFTFRPLPATLVRLNIDRLMAAEHLSPEEGARQALQDVTGHDMRGAVNVIQAAARGGKVTAARVYSTSCCPSQEESSTLYASLQAVTPGTLQNVSRNLQRDPEALLSAVGRRLVEDVGSGRLSVSRLHDAARLERRLSLLCSAALQCDAYVSTWLPG